MSAVPMSQYSRLQQVKAAQERRITELESALTKSASRASELEALNNGLMEANDEALKQVKASASREAALLEKLKVAEGALGAYADVGYNGYNGSSHHAREALAKIKEAS